MHVLADGYAAAGGCIHEFKRMLVVGRGSRLNVLADGYVAVGGWVREFKRMFPLAETAVGMC